MNRNFNLINAFDDTVLAMGKVEGDVWLLDQLERSSKLTCTWAAEWARVALAESKVILNVPVVNEDDKWHLENEKGRVLANPIVAEVYGICGMNRWKVRLDGEVVFHRGFSDVKTARYAETLGFSLFGG